MKRSDFSLLVLVVVSSFSSNALANCRNEGPYPIRQCQVGAFFAPPPAGSGVVRAAWWQLGFGNRSSVDPTLGANTTPNDGDGFINTPLPGIFIGNDSGSLTVGAADGTSTGGMDLIDASLVGAPPGSLCFGSGASWGLPFVDGCADNNVVYWFGGPYDVSDEYLNPYWYTFGGMRGTYSLYSQLDRPMAFLLTEDTNRYFALAFSATKSRGGDANDATPGEYDLGDLSNGDPNPLSIPTGAPNVIPWQEVPQPTIAVSFLDPDDQNSHRVLAMSWNPIRLVHDDSMRPNTFMQVDEDPFRELLGGEIGPDVLGVGVLDQPELARYQVQSRPLDSQAQCSTLAEWVDIGAPVPHPTSTATHIVPPDTCVRLCAIFGRRPRGVFRTDPTSLSQRENRLDAQAAMLGDIGYEVCSRPSRIGGQLFGEKPIVLNAAVTRNRTLTIEFESLSEVAVTHFEILAINRKGTESVLSRVECNECSTGIGSRYSVEIPTSHHGGLAAILVVAKPSGVRSDEMVVKTGREKPHGRGRSPS